MSLLVPLAAYALGPESMPLEEPAIQNKTWLCRQTPGNFKCYFLHERSVYTVDFDRKMARRISGTTEVDQLTSQDIDRIHHSTAPIDQEFDK